MLTFPALSYDPEQLLTQRNALEHSLHAFNTRKSYAHDWKMFCTWCQHVGQTSLPASTETVALYLTDLLSNGRKVSTAARRSAGIGHYHRVAGCPSPVNRQIAALLAGASRARREQPRQMLPFTVEQIRSMSSTWLKDGTMESIRNRTVVVLGFATALRRTNIAALTMGDVAFCEQGVVLNVRHEKNDQEGKGRTIGVWKGKSSDTCLPTCLKVWLLYRGMDAGPLFPAVREKRLKPLTPQAVGRIVKEGAARIGLDPRSYAGHSLRSGFISEAGISGVSHLIIAGYVGHKKMDTLRRYFRPVDIWRANPTERLGL